MTIQVLAESNLTELIFVINKITAEQLNAAEKETAYIAQDIRNEIIESMKYTPKTGREYPRQQGKKIHIASSPGNPPAIDTGELVSRVLAESFENGAIVGVIAGAPYAVLLENPESMNRPFLKPALDKIEPTIEKKIMAAIIASAGA